MEIDGKWSVIMGFFKRCPTSRTMARRKPRLIVLIILRLRAGNSVLSHKDAAQHAAAGCSSGGDDHLGNGGEPHAGVALDSAAPGLALDVPGHSRSSPARQAGAHG